MVGGPPAASRKGRPLKKLVGAGLVLLLAPAGCAGVAAPPATTVEVTPGGCGTGWARPRGGSQTIQIHNAGTVTMEVQLTDPVSHGVYAETEALGPGTTRPMALVLGNGRYAFTCYPDGLEGESGPEVAITDGPAGGGMTAVVPTSENDLAGAVVVYQRRVTGGLATLAKRSAELRRAIGAGDRGRSRAAWLAAQLAYSRLGAAYGTFGDSADAIDGLPAGGGGGLPAGGDGTRLTSGGGGLPAGGDATRLVGGGGGLPAGGDGTRLAGGGGAQLAGGGDRGFSGLRRIERGLWHGEALGRLEAVAERLVEDVAGLRSDFQAERTDPNDLPLRAHEILENALQFELTGDADQGAGAGLAIIGANLEGTRAVLAAIAPVVRPKYAGWAGVQADLDEMTRLVAAQDTADGWTAPGALAAADRRRLAGTLGELLERLAPVASIGEVRRVE